MVEFQVAQLDEFMRALQDNATAWRALGSSGRGVVPLTGPSSLVSSGSLVPGGGDFLTEADLRSLTECVDGLMAICREVKFYSAVQTLRTTTSWIRDGKCLYPAAISEIQHILDSVNRELSLHRFFLLSKDGNNFYGRTFGKEVADAFPSAVPDITEAGNCLGLDRTTATVFHLMRAVEWGMRALCAHLGLARVKAKVKKTGKIRYTPIPYSDWEKMLGELQDKIDAKMARLKRGKQKQAAQEFYYPILQDLRGFRDAWRNHVMHTRRDYNFKDAEAIYGHVRRFMTHLSSKVSEC